MNDPGKVVRHEGKKKREKNKDDNNTNEIMISKEKKKIEKRGKREKIKTLKREIKH